VINQIVVENRKLLGVDVDTTLMYFQKKQEDDAQFFYAIEPDDKCAVNNIFRSTSELDVHIKSLEMLLSLT
jgi:hypothetical protein